MQLEKSSGAAPAKEEEEEEEEDDEDIPEPPPVTRTGNRTSVSAEAYGDWNKPKMLMTTWNSNSSPKMMNLSIHKNCMHFLPNLDEHVEYYRWKF